MALTFCEVDERGDLRAIEKLTRQEIPVVEGHPYESKIPHSANPPRLSAREKERGDKSDRPPQRGHGRNDRGGGGGGGRRGGGGGGGGGRGRGPARPPSA
jgi:ATP-dependent RNA helicase RhlE